MTTSDSWEYLEKTYPFLKGLVHKSSTYNENGDDAFYHTLPDFGIVIHAIPEEWKFINSENWSENFDELKQVLKSIPLHTTCDITTEEPQEPQLTKEEICKFSHEQLLKHHKQFAKILAKFAKGKIPTKDDWAKSVKPFSVWKMEWDRLSKVWDPEQGDYVTREDLKGDE